MLVTKALEAGSDIQISYSPVVRELSVELVYKSGKADTLFSQRIEPDALDGEEDDEEIGPEAALTTRW